MTAPGRQQIGVPAIGSPSAPVTIVEYGDYQCGNCRAFATGVMPWLRETWVARGFVQVMFKDFAILGPESNRAAEAAHCAGEQGRFWAFHEALFEAQSADTGGAFSGENLRSLAEQLGLAGEAFEDCLASGQYGDKVTASTQAALDSGFEGTPTFVINGRSVAGNIPIEDWDDLFRAYESDFAAATVGAP